MIWLLETMIMNAPPADQSKIRVDMYDAGSEGIAFRVVPTAPAARQLIGETRNAQIQILVKSENQREAMQKIEDLTDLYEFLQDKQHVPYNGKYRVISASVYNEPSFVAKTEERFYVYTSILQFELERMV